MSHERFSGEIRARINEREREMLDYITWVYARKGAETIRELIRHTATELGFEDWKKQQQAQQDDGRGAGAN